jgi:hypothetical protein
MVSGQLYTLTASPLIPIIIGPWVDPRTSADVLAMKYWPCRKLKRNSSVIQQMAMHMFLKCLMEGRDDFVTRFHSYIGPNINNNNNNNNNSNNKIGATGTISKSFRKYVSTIPGNHDVKELQQTAILGTAHILRKVLM